MSIRELELSPRCGMLCGCSRGRSCTVTTAQRYWYRRKNRLRQTITAPHPEPAQLYTLLALTLIVHAPLARDGRCESCRQAWPCGPVRLAWRLREGF